MAAVLLTLIIFTGAAVRLTESGLGCENWPKCTDEKLVPEWAFNSWVEFGNRLLSGVVAIGTIAAALTAYRRVPRRTDLIRWSWLLVALVAAQVVLGGITVRLELHPLIVGSHFLLSIVLLWNVAVVWFKAQGGVGKPEPLVGRSLLNHSLATVIAASVLLISGTVVTGTGPNSGDFRATRFNLDLEIVARIHSLTAWTFLALLVSLALRLQRSQLSYRLAQPAILASVAQGALGYWQFATGVPPGLVMFHIVGAVTVWFLVLRMHFGMYRRPREVGGISPPPAVGETQYEANFLHG